jgi:hypothetical protein
MWGVAGVTAVMLLLAISAFQEFGLSRHLLVAIIVLVGLSSIALIMTFPLAWQLNRLLFGRPRR